VGVARDRELRAQSVDGKLLALLQPKRVGREVLQRRQAAERGCDRNEHHVAVVARDLVQGCEPLRYQILVRGEVIVGQRLPVRQQGDAQARGEEGDLRLEPLGVVRGGRDDHERACAGGRFGQEERVARAVQNRHAQARAGARQVDGKSHRAHRQRAPL